MKLFRLPDLGEGLPNAEIHQWHIKEGDHVKVDQTIVSMETAKAIVDVPSPRTGKIIKLYGAVGDIINTHAPLIEFEEGEEEQSKKVSTSVVGNLEIGETVSHEPAMGIIPKTSSHPSIKATPAVRALAKKLQVDLTTIAATGSGGQVTLDDVMTATNAPSLSADFEPLHGTRRTMAQVMSDSHREVVPVTIVDDADIHAWTPGTDITLRIIQAIAAACQAEPALNAWYDGKNKARHLWPDLHLGIAMDSPEGLFVPVLKEVTKKKPEQWREAINRFKEDAAKRIFQPEDLRGTTFTLSNFGTFAGRYATPIVVPPCVAILGVGKIYTKIVVEENVCVTHKVLPLSLTFDHRAVTGGEAARFLGNLIDSLAAI